MSTNLSKQPQSNRILIYLALAGLLAVGLWLRLRFIRTVQPFPDEFVTLLAVQMIGQKGLPVMPSGLFYDHGLLFSYLGSLAAWWGPPRLAVRYASLICGLLSIALTFWVGRRWFSPAVGLIAATGLAIAPAAIQWSGRARMYALLQVLILLSLWLVWEGIVRNRPGWRWAALLAYLAATLTHFGAVTLAPPLVLAAMAWWWLPQSRVAKRQESPGSTTSPALRSILAQAVALCLILIVAFLVKRAGQPKGLEALVPANALAGVAQVWAIYSDLSWNLAGGWQAISPFYLTWPALIFAPFAGVAIIGALWPASRQPVQLVKGPVASWRPGAFLAVILLITTLEMIFFVSADRRDDKYLFMLLPVLFLLGAWGMVLVGRRLLAWFDFAQDQSPGSPLQTVATLLISGLLLIVTRPAVQSLLANTGDDYDSAFAYVRQHWQPGDKILTGTPAAAAFYLGRNDFYSVQRRGGYDYRILGVDGQAVDRWLASPAIRTEADLHQTLASHSVWLVLERWGLQREYYDLPFQQQLLAQTDYAGEVQGIFILHSRPDPHPLAPDPVHPVQALFGDQVRLDGYTLEPEKPAAGQTVRLTLYWQALAPMPHDYTVFVHLRQPAAGGNVAQADHRPLGSLYPTTLWPVGETIRESSDLPLPAGLAPGTYDLWAGLYLLETGQRLPVQNDASGENAVKLGQVTVGEP